MKKIVLWMVGVPFLALLAWATIPQGKGKFSYSPTSVVSRGQRLFYEMADLFYFPGPSLNERLPKSFEPPQLLKTAKFQLRPLSPDVYQQDYEAVMASRNELVGALQPGSPWPEEDLTPLDNYLQLVSHKKQFDQRYAFAYTVESLDGKTTLGCVYINPTPNLQYDVDVRYWIRTGQDTKELDQLLGSTLITWLKTDWPFQEKRMAFPGRGVAWTDYLALDKDATTEQ